VVIFLDLVIKAQHIAIFVKTSKEHDEAGLDAGEETLEARIIFLVLVLFDHPETKGEAKGQAKSATERLRLAGEEKSKLSTSLKEAQAAQQVADNRIAELQGSAKEFNARAKDAIEQARQSIRIMVTAPKVSINVGNSQKDLHVPFPFSAIQNAVESDIMPKFAKVVAVADGEGDSEIRQNVQNMVQELALTLQTKVHELVPAADASC